jgi:hypothetical protein
MMSAKRLLISYRKMDDIFVPELTRALAWRALSLRRLRANALSYTPDPVTTSPYSK